MMTRTSFRSIRQVDPRSTNDSSASCRVGCMSTVEKIPHAAAVSIYT